MHEDQASFEKEKENNHYESLHTLDKFDDSISDDDELDRYEPWCHNTVIYEIVK